MTWMYGLEYALESTDRRLESISYRNGCVMQGRVCHLGYVFFFQEELPRRPCQGPGSHSAHRGVSGQSGIRCVLFVWTHLQGHVHELCVY